MSLVEPDRVRSKLGSPEECHRGLEDKQDCARSEHVVDRDLQDIVERRFEKAIQASIDIASHIVAAEGHREPSNFGDLFRILESEGVLSGATAEGMVEMAGFRNVLAHANAEINDEYVYEHLQDLEHFRQFAKEVSEEVLSGERSEEAGG